MRDFSPILHKPTREEIDKVWREAIFAFDASVLLHVFRINKKACEQFLQVLELLKERIWIPHEAFQGYENNWNAEHSRQYEKCDAMLEMLEKLEPRETLSGKYKHHPFVDLQNIDSIYKKAISKSKNVVEAARKQASQLFSPDEIRASVTNIIQDRIGQIYSERKLNDVRETAKIRYMERRPPGYLDAEGKKGNRPKPEPDRYEDVVLWFQLKDFAKNQKNPIVFITDDLSEDWWIITDNKVVAPRPELTQEMISETGVPLYMYTFKSFLDYAGNFLRVPTYEASKVAEALQRQDKVQKGHVFIESGQLLYGGQSGVYIQGQDGFSLRFYDADDVWRLAPHRRPRVLASANAGDTINIGASLPFMYGSGERVLYKGMDTNRFHCSMELNGSLKLSHSIKDDFILHTPFTASGSVVAYTPGYLPIDPRDNKPLFEVTFEGSGEAEISSRIEHTSFAGHHDRFIRQTITYSFL